MSRVILFGAGASYGSVAAEPHVPPLGANLFDELRKTYPEAWGRIPEEDKEKFVPNFELGMGEIWNGGRHDGPVLMRCMAHYFARFRPSAGSLYGKLIEELGSRSLLDGTYFSSLNYECLLELALRNEGYDIIEYFAEGATKRRSATVWKIHGSCNFIPMSVRGLASGVSISSGVRIEGELRAVSLAEAREFSAVSAFSPAIAVFMEGKPVQSCPSAIADLQRRWAEAVHAASKVGIVGVHPHQVDRHIWDPLSETGAEVVIIGNELANREWREMRRSDRPTVILGEYFDNHVADFADSLAE